MYREVKLIDLRPGDMLMWESATECLIVSNFIDSDGKRYAYVMFNRSGKLSMINYVAEANNTSAYVAVNEYVKAGCLV